MENWDDCIQYKAEPNSLKLSSREENRFYKHSGVKTKTIRLRGRNYTEGTHHEVLATLVNGIHVRISRTNGVDTFQIGALEVHEGKDMPTLAEHNPKGGSTCRDLLSAFGEVRRNHPLYEQADCQAFAKSFIRKTADVDDNTQDDNFM